MGFEIIGTDHLKARCVCVEFSTETGDVLDTRGCPIHQNPKPVPDPGIDMVNHPPHYSHHPSGIEAIQISRHMTFDAGNSFKYVYRTDAKNGLENVDKARWYWEDVLAYHDPIWLPTWQACARRPLLRIIQTETDDNRKRFYTSILTLNRQAAMTAIQAMLT